MSRTVDIFIDSKAALASIRADLEAGLAIRFTPASEGDEHWLEFENDQIEATLGEHSLENDRDLNFEDYRYQLSIRALNLATEVDRKQWRERFARRAFDALRLKGNYRLMMAEDVQHKLEEFIPGREQRTG